MDEADFGHFLLPVDDFLPLRAAPGDVILPAGDVTEGRPGVAGLVL